MHLFLFVSVTQLGKVEQREAAKRKGAASNAILKDAEEVRKIVERFADKLRDHTVELSAAEACAAETRQAEMATFHAQQARTAKVWPHHHHHHQASHFCTCLAHDLSTFRRNKTCTAPAAT